MPARLHVMVSELPDPASRPATNAEPTSVAPPRAETTSSEESNALQYMRLERDAALEELAFLREQLRSTEAYYAHRLEVMFAGLYHAPALALPQRNRLLGALSRAELTALLPHLELVRLEHQDTFFEPAGPIDYVLFPETAVVSFVSTFEDGGTVEVGTAGCEG
ncbi:MAG TPA: hypothetical protein VF461_02920, partial [Gemmatimonadaceae bacterium]